MSDEKANVAVLDPVSSSSSSEDGVLANTNAHGGDLDMSDGGADTPTSTTDVEMRLITPQHTPTPPTPTATATNTATESVVGSGVGGGCDPKVKDDGNFVECEVGVGIDHTQSMIITDPSIRGRRLSDDVDHERDELARETLAVARIIRVWQKKGNESSSVAEFDTHLDSKVRKINNIMLFLVLLGIVLLFMELQIGYDATTQKYITVTRSDKYVYNFVQIIKICISIDTIILLYYHYAYYLTQLDILRQQQAEQASTLIRRRIPPPTLLGILQAPTLRWYFLLGGVVLIPHPFPDFGIFRAGNEWIEKMGLYMLLRLYITFRVIRDHSLIYDNRAFILKSSFAQMYGFPKFDWALSFKFAMKQRPAQMILMISVALVSLMTYFIYINERETQEDLNSFWTVTYFALITMTTVGYGDYSAISRLGRFSTVVAGIVGLFVSALLIALLTAKLELTPRQNYAADWIVRETLRTKARVAAARCIAYSWKQRVPLRLKNPVAIDELRELNKALRRARAQLLKHSGECDQVLPRLISLERTASTMEHEITTIAQDVEEIKTLLQTIAEAVGVPSNHVQELRQEARNMRSETVMKAKARLLAAAKFNTMYDDPFDTNENAPVPPGPPQNMFAADRRGTLLNNPLKSVTGMVRRGSQSFSGNATE